MNKNKMNYLTAFVGLALLAVGLFIIKSEAMGEGIMKTLPYICIGVGCGVFGQGAGNILGDMALKNDAELKKQMEIEKNDERNIALENKAKAKAYDIMVFVFGALMVSFALMSAPMHIILMLVFAYLFVCGSMVYYLNKYDKEY